MEAGDVLHVQPWIGHSIVPVENESSVNILFTGMDQQFSFTKPRIRLQQKFPGVFEDAEFNDMFKRRNGGVGDRTYPGEVHASREHVQQLRCSGVGLREHEFLNIKMHLKVARYETEGIKEIWEYIMDPGFYCEWDNFLPEYHLFYITSGKIHCTVKESFTESVEFDATKDTIVFIPPYYPFRFEVLEETKMYDLDCPSRLQDLCEEVEACRTEINDVARENTSLLELCKEYDFNCTDFGIKTI